MPGRRTPTLFRRNNFAISSGPLPLAGGDHKLVAAHQQRRGIPPGGNKAERRVARRGSIENSDGVGAGIGDEKPLAIGGLRQRQRDGAGILLAGEVRVQKAQHAAAGCFHNGYAIAIGQRHVEQLFVRAEH